MIDFIYQRAVKSTKETSFVINPGVVSGMKGGQSKDIEPKPVTALKATTDSLTTFPSGSSK